ncbi:hypothetical protein Afil01_13890 [Actinorhabdospora filicis]|uniref:Uncharacterized protein n=1 Tax=Actinorhabdospora filicis TaxID=1785913 RepID=A0A9W6W238_9ACTN|nr:hypothetical protein [Actinorhabdospora filicis]GLZ76582.1 hypothetical protein Afil01_13890 [Actinorhabdospora filicis]
MPMNVRGLLGVLAAVGAAALVTGYLALPTPAPVPTLVGVTPATGTPPVGTTHAYPLVGVPTTTPGERAHALAVALRRDHPRLGPTVQRTIGGLPAVEYAYTDANGDWTGVATAWFPAGTMVVQDCGLDGFDRPARLAECAQVLDQPVTA